MASVKGPLFSLDASGTIAGAVVFSKWKGRNYVRRHAVPANPKSVGQVSSRVMLKFLSQFWDSLTAGEQTGWETRAASTNISPFNAFVAYNMSRWGINTPPSRADPATETGTPGTIANEAATAGVKSILLEDEVTVLGDNWGILVFRDPVTGLTGTRNQLVQVIPAVSAAVFSWLDTPLVTGTEMFYKFQAISDDGVTGALGAEVSATPT